MKIYTRKGDDGTTALLGGTRLPKHHIRIESYGTVDELNSFIGLLRDHVKDPKVNQTLIRIQEELFTLGSHLAADPAKNRMKLPDIPATSVLRLEAEMDGMEALLPEMRNFILPGGHAAVSFAHVCRCVCRRAERLCVALSEAEKVDPVIVRYLNRLSDYFFVLARKIAHDNGVKEHPWNVPSEP
jgi:cob(I)alamin adenosyltransferase